MFIEKLIPSSISKLEARDATRLGIQSAISAILTYILLRYFNLPEVFVGILSAVLVIDNSVGNTIGQAKERVLSTLIGSIIGFLCVWILPYGYSTAISLLISMLLINSISSFRPAWRYGTVAAVALSLGSEANALSTSLDRIIAISIGVVIGIITALIVWPEKAEKRSFRFVRRALNAACDRFENAIDDTRKKDSGDDPSVSSSFHVNLQSAKASMKAAKFADIQKLKTIIDRVEKLYNSILIINRVADQSHEKINDDGSGIENDYENIKDAACEIMRSLAKKEETDADLVEEFQRIVDSAKNDVKISDDKNVNMRRQTFIFGIKEVEKNIRALVDSFKESDL